MRFLRPSPGECADRQTILQIKMRVAAQQGKPLEHFVAENNEILAYLQKNWFPESVIKRGPSVADEWDELWEKLERVNQRLWDLEDEIRSILALSSEKQTEKVWEVFRIGTAIPIENDKRAKLVEEINLLFDVQTREKIYTNVVTKLKEMVNQ